MMKKIVLLFTFILAASCYVEAQPRHHSHHGGALNFTVSSQTKHSFWLFIDDVIQNEQAVKSICVQGLDDGDHYVRIELDNMNHNTVGQFITLSKPNTNYCITMKNGFYGLSAYNVPIYPEMTVNYINNQQPMLPPPPVHAEMNPNDFEAAYDLLSKESFDNTRLKVAKQIASTNLLSVNQIKRICQLFSFENNKLEFAKYAYNSCVDQNNYFKLNEVFKFESDKQQLNSFINHQ